MRSVSLPVWTKTARFAARPASGENSPENRLWNCFHLPEILNWLSLLLTAAQMRSTAVLPEHSMPVCVQKTSRRKLWANSSASPEKTINEYSPTLLVSLYHRSEDAFALPLLIKEKFPQYKLYLRRYRYIPAWDLNLICVSDR